MPDLWQIRSPVVGPQPWDTIYAIGMTLAGAARSVPMKLVGRLLGGVGQGLFFSTAGVWQVESAPSRVSSFHHVLENVTDCKRCADVVDPGSDCLYEPTFHSGKLFRFINGLSGVEHSTRGVDRDHARILYMLRLQSICIKLELEITKCPTSGCIGHYGDSRHGMSVFLFRTTGEAESLLDSARTRISTLDCPSHE